MHGLMSPKLHEMYCRTNRLPLLTCQLLHPASQDSVGPLHCTALHCTALHCTALHCTALQPQAAQRNIALTAVLNFPAMSMVTAHGI
jgi:hypothetical protein